MQITIEQKQLPYLRLAPHTYKNKKHPADLRDGETLTITNEGEHVSTTYGQKIDFNVKTESGENRRMTFNKTSLANLAKAFGTDSESWVNRKVHATVSKTEIDGTKRLQAILTA